MELTPIIKQLREYCPSFGGLRVSGAAEFKKLEEKTAVPVPAAFIVPLDDNLGESAAQNAVRMPLTDSFAVIVCVDNSADERGQGSYDQVHALRTELWAALLGFQPKGAGQAESRYEGITYAGGALLKLDRSRLWYQFEFEAEMELGPEDGWQERELAALPDLKAVHIDVDAIAPMAQQVPGPDGRIEHVVVVPPDGDLPPPP